MNRNEAYSILEIPQGSSKEDAKKKFRELSKKFHPDINKEEGAEAKFKKINEAYQVISSGRSTDPQQPYQPTHIQLSTTISFKESVLGTKRELKFSRKSKCGSCNGNGEVIKDNGCDKCQGRGQIVHREGFMVNIQSCPKCYGRRNVEPCSSCDTQGILDVESTVDVTIPGGVQTGNVLRLAGVGNFAGSFGGLMDQHTDVFLQLTVTPEDGLSLLEKDVVSTVQISLLDALKGCKRTVKTILGEQDIQIKPKSKNKDEVLIPHVGVNRLGNQRVVLDVQYPTDIDSLIKTLSKEGT